MVGATQRWQLHIHDDTAHLDPINLTLDRRNLTHARFAITPADADRHLRAALELVEGPPFTGGQHDGYTWAHTEGAASHAIITIDDAAHQLAQRALTIDDPDTATWAARKGILVTGICEHCYRNLIKAGIATNNPPSSRPPTNTPLPTSTSTKALTPPTTSHPKPSRSSGISGCPTDLFHLPMSAADRSVPFRDTTTTSAQNAAPP